MPSEGNIPLIDTIEDLEPEEQTPAPSNFAQNKSEDRQEEISFNAGLNSNPTTPNNQDYLLEHHPLSITPIRDRNRRLFEFLHRAAPPLDNTASTNPRKFSKSLLT
jgi:hypothetical protein